MWKRLSLALLLFSISATVMSEYRPQVLSRALGEYIASADFMAKILNSNCGHLLKDKPETKKQILTDAYLVLLRSDYQQIIAYLESKQYKESIDTKFATAVKQAKQIGKNREKTCEYLYLNFTIHHRYARDKWQFARKFHAR
jgi:hypothetical protein